MIGETGHSGWSPSSIPWQNASRPGRLFCRPRPMPGRGAVIVNDKKASPVALVTGASRGIGRAIAAHLCAAGFGVAGVSRPRATCADPNAAEWLRREMLERGADYLPVHEDVSDLRSHRRIIDGVLKHFGRLDVFVGNAGISPSPRRDVLEMTSDSYDRVLGLNLRGAVFLATAAARAMLAAAAVPPPHARAVILITSVSAALSSVDRAEDCIAKAGLSMAAKILADRLASDGISVFEVRPGVIRTDMTAAVQERYDREIADGLVPQRRWGEPADVARAVVSLARGDFAYSTGTVIDVGGGIGLQRL
jgi:3-oxoacyl-[acyl-carrier protein] reductase